MYKILNADKDTYITDKVVRGSRKLECNVGNAGTLDLFKLYGMSMTESVKNTELSRILIHFDLESLKVLSETGKIDINDPSFWCELHLHDVYGGQTCPIDFTISVFPLSSSFTEGFGRDVSYYSDSDICNWITSSLGTKWYTRGCALQCDASGLGDYITSSISLPTTEITQYFKTGEEDLKVDITSLVSATLSHEIPDCGFRISLEKDLENDELSYFVKRFASRTAYNEAKRPKLHIGYNDSVSDGSQFLTFDESCDLFLYNYVGHSQANIVSGSSLEQVTGSSCIFLKLIMPISGGSYDLIFTGSQRACGTEFVTGTYFSSVLVSSFDSVISHELTKSSSIDFTTVWESKDHTVAYVTGSTITARYPTRTSTKNVGNYLVNVIGLREEYFSDETSIAQLHICDRSVPFVKVVHVPVELPGIVVRNAYYQIRDSLTDEKLISFDSKRGSTKISSDSSGMFFEIDMSNLIPGRTYIVDIELEHNGELQKFPAASPVFRVNYRT